MRLLVIALAACGPPDLTAPQQQRAGEVMALVDGDRLYATLVELETVRSTEATSLTRLETARYFTTQLEALGLVVQHETAPNDGVDVDNLIVDIPGELTDQVILAAHYDSFYLGADDNASGVAVLLETARVFATLPAPRRTLRIIAFDREEYNQIGSTYYVDLHRDDHVRAVIVMDCVAYTAATQMSLPGISAPATGDFLLVIANDRSEHLATWSAQLYSPILLAGLIAPDDGIYPATSHLMRSDHAPFWRVGTPAVLFTDTADFRNPNYHSASDTVATIDRAFFAAAARIIIGTTAAALEER